MKKLTIGIIDYGVGNIGSIGNMLSRAGSEPFFVRERADFARCDKYILPGVGSFSSAMQLLQSSPLLGELNAIVASGEKSVLGICLGMQMLFEGSDEGGSCKGLGWIPGRIVKFNTEQPFPEPLPVPHMGWSKVALAQESPLFDGLLDNRFYHVHSYHVITDACYVIGKTLYGYQYVTAVNHGKVYGVQFHPEKSHRFGMRMMQNFAKLCV